MFLVAVGEISVYFIGNDDEVMLFCKVRHGQKILFSHNGAGGVVGVANEKRLGLFGDMLFQLCCRDAEGVFLLGRHSHRHAAGQDSASLVGYIAGLRDQHLVSRGEDSTHGYVQGLADTYGDKDICIPVVGSAIILLVVPGYLLPQLRHATVGGVGSIALLQSIDAGFPDGPGGHEVRLSYAQGNDIFHLGSDVKELADA